MDLEFSQGIDNTHLAEYLVKPSQKIPFTEAPKDFQEFYLDGRFWTQDTKYSTFDTSEGFIQAVSRPHSSIAFFDASFNKVFAGGNSLYDWGSVFSASGPVIGRKCFFDREGNKSFGAEMYVEKIIVLEDGYLAGYDIVSNKRKYFDRSGLPFSNQRDLKQFDNLTPEEKETVRSLSKSFLEHVYAHRSMSVKATSTIEREWVKTALQYVKEGELDALAQTIDQCFEEGIFSLEK